MLKYINFMYKQNHLNPSLTGNLLTFKHTFKHVWLRVFLAYCKLQPANCKDKEVYQLEAGKLIAILICGTLRGGRC